MFYLNIDFCSQLLETWTAELVVICGCQNSLRKMWMLEITGCVTLEKFALKRSTVVLEELRCEMIVSEIYKNSADH